MKLNGHLEVSGIRNIVIDRYIMFRRYEDDVDWFYITRNGDHVFVSPEVMKEKIQKFMDNEYYKVWVHGETINIVYEGYPVW